MNSNSILTKAPGKFLYTELMLLIASGLSGSKNSLSPKAPRRFLIFGWRQVAALVAISSMLLKVGGILNIVLMF